MAEFILEMATMVSEKDYEEMVAQNKNFASIDGDFLKKYIKYAKKNCYPILTDEAKERIKEFYLDLRGRYDSSDAIVSILARQLEALVRLSEAYAKMALRNKVRKEDVEEIIILFKRYLKDTGYDKETGKIDMDILYIGQSRSKINKLALFMDRLKEIFEENNWKSLEKKNVIQILELEEKLDKEFIKNAITEAINEGTLYEPRPKFIKFTSRPD
jgi:replicative DNA helicase Mcm